MFMIIRGKFMELLNIIFSLLLLSLILYETFLIFTRNRKIIVKGKEDFFTSVLLVFFTMILFPIKENGTLIESFRNTLIYLAIFGTLPIKKGLSSNGFEMSLFSIPWSSCPEILMQDTFNQNFEIIIQGKFVKLKLIFHKMNFQNAVSLIQKYAKDIKVQVSLTKGM